MVKISIPGHFRKLTHFFIKIGIFDIVLRRCNVWLFDGKFIGDAVLDVSGDFVWVPEEFGYIKEGDIANIKASWARY